MMSKMMITMVAGAAAFIDCGNGFGCSTGFCTSTSSKAGARYGCTPPALGDHARVCSDRRFSCAKGDACGLAEGQCVGANNATSPLFLNENAEMGGSLTVKDDITVCGVIAPALPSFCDCEDTTTRYGGIISCDIDVLGIDTLTFTADLQPCGIPAKAAFTIAESAVGFHWTWTYKEGKRENIDIGLDIGVPDFVNAGIYLVVEIDGSPSDLDLKMGIDVCATALGVQECGSKISSTLPIWILDADFTFTNVCDTNNTDVSKPKQLAIE